MNNLYHPVLLKSACLSALWGGDMLYHAFGKGEEGDCTGESWELSVHQNGVSMIASGKLAGMSFDRYLNQVFGEWREPFELLVKLIGPTLDLSVQVHPPDGYCGLAPGESGKTEAWYVLAAPQNSKIICGTSCGRSKLLDALRNDEVSECLAYVNVKPGDVVEIPAGMVHALCKDIIVYEIQQSSDATYRIYDWGRVDAFTGQPRKLDVQRALDVIDFSLQPKVRRSPEGQGRHLLVKNDKFILEKIVIKSAFEDDAAGFSAYTVVNGRGEVAAGGVLLFHVKSGDTFFAPVCNGWSIAGEMTLLKASMRA